MKNDTESPPNAALGGQNTNKNNIEGEEPTVESVDLKKQTNNKKNMYLECVV